MRHRLRSFGRLFLTSVKAVRTLERKLLLTDEGDESGEISYAPRNSQARILAKQFLSLALSYLLIFSSTTAFTMATARAQAVDQPDTPKLKTSTGEAVLRTTEPPMKNLPSLEEMKRKGEENDQADKIKKVKTEAERLPQAVRCRPADKDCQEYWKKQGKPSSNIGWLMPSDNQTNSFTNLIASNLNPYTKLFPPAMRRMQVRS